jgi:hypothetical protein
MQRSTRALWDYITENTVFTSLLVRVVMWVDDITCGKIDDGTEFVVCLWH